MQRCKARSKRSGNQCKNFALKEWGVCRMHGARGGPKTKQGYCKCKTAPFRHGFYSQEGQKELRTMCELIKQEARFLRED
jgi:hypothetical protein